MCPWYDEFDKLLQDKRFHTEEEVNDGVVAHQHGLTQTTYDDDNDEPTFFDASPGNSFDNEGSPVAPETYRTNKRTRVVEDETAALAKKIKRHTDTKLSELLESACEIWCDRLTVESKERVRIAAALHQDRCIRTVRYIKTHNVPSVVKFFTAQKRISLAIAKALADELLPHLTKRSVNPNSMIGQLLKQPEYADQRSPAPFRDLFGNVFPSKDVEMNEDFHDNANGSEPESMAEDISERVSLNPQL
ncbi:hypothetical protein MBANPS3_012266 [Mucor bainieri]